MYHPTTRLLTVLELLQSYPRLTGPELAERLEVDVRTVRRYIMMLQDLGIPVEGEIGRLGGYCLRPGYKLPPLMFTEYEVVALTVGLLLARQAGLGTTVAASGALAKIERVLPQPLRDQTKAVQQTLGLGDEQEQGVDGALLGLLSKAARDGSQITFAYQSRGSEMTSRVADPYGIAAHDGHFYLVAYCHLRTDKRIFRLDKMRDTRLSGGNFNPPANFDAHEYVLSRIATIPDRWDIEILLKVDMTEARRKLPRGFGLLEQQPDGVLLRSGTNDLDSTARFLIGLGLPLSVIRPGEFREAFGRLAAEISRIAEG